MHLPSLRNLGGDPGSGFVADIQPQVDWMGLRRAHSALGPELSPVKLSPVLPAGRGLCSLHAADPHQVLHLVFQDFVCGSPSNAESPSVCLCLFLSH